LRAEPSPLSGHRHIHQQKEPLDMTSDTGFVVWLTGLSGAGKSTIAAGLAPHLRERAHRVELLDGDEVRTNLCQGLGFSRADRDTNIARIGWVAAKLAEHGVAVLVAAISPYQEARDRVRQSVARRVGARRFIEVHVAASLQTCVERDVKGLYAKALTGQISNFTGVSDPYEPPSAPELVLRTEREDVPGSVQRVLAHLERSGLVRPGVAVDGNGWRGPTEQMRVVHSAD
jgi:adenylylsulfate kinase